MFFSVTLFLHILVIALILGLALLPTDPAVLIVIGLFIWVYYGWRARPALVYMMLLANGLVHWTNAVPALQRHWSWTPLGADSKCPGNPDPSVRRS